MPSNRPSLLDHFRAIAGAASGLANAVGERFPLAGHEWRSVDEYRRDPDQTVREVLNWVFKLENRINPGRLPFDHPLRGKVVSKQSLVKITPLRGEFELGLRRIVTAFDDLKRHYSWENMFTTDRERLDFKPFSAEDEPTPIAADILNRLAEGASLLGTSIHSALQSGSGELKPMAAEPTGAELLPIYLSASDLASLTGLSVDQVDSFLRRHRRGYPDCYIENESPRRNEPRYLYRTADVLPALLARAKSLSLTDE
jgi:hypothetical protein